MRFGLSLFLSMVLASSAATLAVAQAPAIFYRPAPDKTPIIGQPTIANTSSLTLNGKRIVFHGVDPVMARNPCYVGNQQWDCGAAALRTLMNFIGREPVTCEPRVVDTFSRIYAKCTVHDEDIAMMLTKEGFAVAVPEETRDYVAAQQEAKAAKKGAWRGTFTTPAEFREIQNGYPKPR